MIKVCTFWKTTRKVADTYWSCDNYNFYITQKAYFKIYLSILDKQLHKKMIAICSNKNLSHFFSSFWVSPVYPKSKPSSFLYFKT